MQNFLFRKNSHSASVVAKALPRPPESPPSPALRPRLGLRLAHPTNRRRQPPSHGPPPPKTGVPQKQRRENARKPECRDANGPRHRRNAPRQAGMPLCRRTKPQDTAICKSPSDVWADGASERIRRFAAECRSDTSQSSCKSVGRGRMLSAASENPPPRPRSSGGRDRAPARLPRRSGEEAKRPTAPYSARGRRQRRRAAKPAQSDVCANLLRGPDKKTSGPIRTPRPARHRAGYDTHTRYTADSAHPANPHKPRRAPHNAPPARKRHAAHNGTAPRQAAMQRAPSPHRDEHRRLVRPRQIAQPGASLQLLSPAGYNALNPAGYNVRSPPAGYDARNLAEYNARSPAGYDAPASPDTTFAAPPDTAFPHRSRTIPSTPLRPVRYKSGTAAARTAESRSKL